MDIGNYSWVLNSSISWTSASWRQHLDLVSYTSVIYLARALVYRHWRCWCLEGRLNVIARPHTSSNPKSLWREIGVVWGLFPALPTTPRSILSAFLGLQLEMTILACECRVGHQQACSGAHGAVRAWQSKTNFCRVSYSRDSGCLHHHKGWLALDTVLHISHMQTSQIVVSPFEWRKAHVFGTKAVSGKISSFQILSDQIDTSGKEKLKERKGCINISKDALRYGLMMHERVCAVAFLHASNLKLKWVFMQSSKPFLPKGR